MRLQLSFSVVLLCANVSAQQNDQAKIVGNPSDWSANASMWMWDRAELENPVVAFRGLVYRNDDLFEFRYNFEQTRANSFYWGHRWNIGKKLGLSFAPAFGVTTYNTMWEYGYRARTLIGFTSHTTLDRERWKIYSINQHSFALTHNTTNITYNFTDAAYKVNKWLRVGLAEQIRISGKLDDLDIGPALGAEIGKSFFVRAYAWDLWSQEERYFGVWWGWDFKDL